MSNANQRDVIIIGAGPAGLAVARRLTGTALDVQLLEKTECIGDVWANHYDGLRLNTVARLSGLADYAFPATAGRWPGKQAVVQQLQLLAKQAQATIETNQPVRTITYDAKRSLWTVRTNSKEYIAPKVVLATGMNQQPILPSWVDKMKAHCRVLHSLDYRSPNRFEGQNVLVVGGGNSGAEIACRVAEKANRVWLSLRAAPLVLPKQLAGIGFTYMGLGLRYLPAVLRANILRAIQRFSLGDHSAYGLPLPSLSYLCHQGKDRAPTFYPDFLNNVKKGKVSIHGEVNAVVKGQLHIQRTINGQALKVLAPDSIICATGFKPEPKVKVMLNGTNVVNDVVQAACRGQLNPVPGVYILGFVSPISGQFREIDKQSKKIAARIKACFVPQGQAPHRVTTKARNKPKQLIV